MVFQAFSAERLLGRYLRHHTCLQWQKKNKSPLGSSTTIRKKRGGKAATTELPVQVPIKKEEEEDLDKKVKEGFRIAANLTRTKKVVTNKGDLPAVACAAKSEEPPTKPLAPSKPQIRRPSKPVAVKSNSLMRFPRQPLTTYRKSTGYRPGFLARKYWNTFDGVAAR